jgi:hypothetical protein
MTYADKDKEREQHRNWMRLNRAAGAAIEGAEKEISKRPASDESDESPTVTSSTNGKAEGKANEAEGKAPYGSKTPKLVPTKPWKQRRIKEPEDLLAAVSYSINALLAQEWMDRATQAKSLSPLLNVGVAIIKQTKIVKDIEGVEAIAKETKRLV